MVQGYNDNEVPLPVRHSTAGAWTMVGVGGAAVVAGAVMAVYGQSRADEIAGLRSQTWLDHTCTAPSCDQELTDANSRISRAQGLQTVGWITMGVGAATAIGGVTWLFLGSRSEGTTTSLRLSPMGVSLTGAS